MEKYDFGFTWEPSQNVFVGLKHESLSKEKLQLGKFLLYFQHNANFTQQVGSEFALDWQKRILEARLGYLHRLNEDTSAKLKINHHGYVDLLLKHKISSVLSLGLTTGLNLKSVISDRKGSALPVGVSFDFKF